MAKRRGFNTSQVLELVLQHGSDEELEVDHYEGSNEITEDEDFAEDVPEIDGNPEYETDEDGELNDKPGADDGGEENNGAGDALPEFELEENDNDALYDADTEVESDPETIDDDISVWAKNLRHFPNVPEFGNRVTAGLQSHVFEGKENPTPLDAYLTFFTLDFIEKIRHETNEYAK